MAASYCTCMAWGIVPPHASVVVLAPWLVSCVLAHTPVEVGLLVWGGDLSCGAETCRARWRLVVGIPLAGNLSEMQPTG
jgi:hypothetical protein